MILNFFTQRNVVHSNHIFVITMQLISKLIDSMTNNVLVLHVHVIVQKCGVVHWFK
jgi:hypothetical protein